MTRLRIFCTTLFTNNNIKIVIKSHTFQFHLSISKAVTWTGHFSLFKYFQYYVKFQTFYRILNRKSTKYRHGRIVPYIKTILIRSFWLHKIVLKRVLKYNFFYYLLMVYWNWDIFSSTALVQRSIWYENCLLLMQN